VGSKSAKFATVRIQSVAELTAATFLGKHDEYEDIRSVAQDCRKVAYNQVFKDCMFFGSSESVTTSKEEVRSSATA
jgi:hypothetical protein